MQKEDDPTPKSQGRGLRTAVVVFAVLSVAASAFAVVERGQISDERARNERLAAELAASRARVAALEDEIGGETPPPDDPDNGNESSTDPFTEAFGGADVGAIIKCVNATATGTAVSDDAADAQGQFDTISKAIANIRELKLKKPVDVSFLTPEQVAGKAAKITLRDYPQRLADIESRMLGALGAIPAGTDLRQLTKDLIESQVAGFYVPSLDEMFVPGSADEPLSPTQKVVLAHELTHAVTDQTIGIPLPNHPSPEKLDQTLAALSVIEGDATLAMQRYATVYLSIFDQLSLTNDPAYQASQEAMESTPHYLVQQLSAPYIDGLGFTCELFNKGGWDAINDAYENPPTTTAQVLFPERYFDNEGAIKPSAPSAPKGNWKEVFVTSFGAANLQWLFEAPGGDESQTLDEPRKLVEGWAGGTVYVWTDGDETALSMRLTERKGSDLCSSVVEWYDRSFDDSEAETTGSEELALDGEAQDAVIACSGSEVHVGIGPDLDTARSINR
jgi:hypothetical protein